MLECVWENFWKQMSWSTFEVWVPYKSWSREEQDDLRKRLYFDNNFPHSHLDHLSIRHERSLIELKTFFDKPYCSINDVNKKFGSLLRKVALTLFMGCKEENSNLILKITNYLISWNFSLCSWKYDWTTWDFSERSYFFRWEEKLKFILLIVTMLLYCLAVYCSGPGSMVRGLSVLSK